MVRGDAVDDDIDLGSKPISIEPVVEDLTARDIEMSLLVMIAYFGDGKISEEELELLASQAKTRFQDSIFSDYSDSKDIELCVHEYLLWILDTIHSLREETLKQQIELPDVEASIVTEFTSKLCGIYDMNAGLNVASYFQDWVQPFKNSVSKVVELHINNSDSRAVELQAIIKKKLVRWPRTVWVFIVFIAVLLIAIF